MEKVASINGSQSWSKHTVTFTMKPSVETLAGSTCRARRLWFALTILANQSSILSLDCFDARMMWLTMSRSSAWCVCKVSRRAFCELIM